MIEINNLTRGRVDKRFIKKIIETVLRGERSYDKDISVAIVGQNTIRKLNRIYLKRNRATDVLSFSDPPEIVICSSIIKRNAKIFGEPFKREFARVVIHGILNVLGRRTIRKEEHYLRKLIRI